MTINILLLLVVLPILAHADNSIQIDIWNSPDNETLMHANGVARNIMKDGDMCVCGITEDGLKSGIQALSGASPNDVFLRDPTGSFANQFAINNWPQGYTILGVENYKMINSWKTTRVVNTYTLRNSAAPLVFTGNYKINGFDTVENYWSRNSSRETGQPIQYDINLQNGKSRMKYVSAWGRNLLYTRKKEVSTKFNFTVGHEQLLRASVIAIEGYGEARVTYQAGLDGNVIGHFSRGHNGRNFWPFDLNSAVRMGQMSSRFRIVENIRYYYIAGVNIELTFTDMRKEVYPCDIYDLEDKLIANPTAEEILNVKKITIKQ